MASNDSSFTGIRLIPIIAMRSLKSKNVRLCNKLDPKFVGKYLQVVKKCFDY